MAKTGRLAQWEQKIIKKHMDTKSSKEIVDLKLLDRTAEQIEEWIQRQKGTPIKELPTPLHVEVAVKAELRDSLVWKNLRKELTAEEVRRFEEEYGNFKAQFKDDIEASENTQLFQMLKLEILASRNLVDQKNIRDEIKDTENELKKFLEQFPDGIPAGDTISKDVVFQTRNHISQLRAQISSLTSEHQKVMSESKHLMKDLKATRRDRIAEIKDSNVSWLGLIRELDDKDQRQREQTQMELIRVAADKEYKRLSQPHRYANNESDLPILSHESVRALEESNKGAQ